MAISLPENNARFPFDPITKEIGNQAYSPKIESYVDPTARDSHSPKALRLNAIRADRMQAIIAVKRAVILLRFDWLTGLIGALLW